MVDPKSHRPPDPDVRGLHPEGLNKRELRVGFVFLPGVADEPAAQCLVPPRAFRIQGIHIADDERGNDPRRLQMTGAPVGTDHRRRFDRRQLIPEKRRISQLPSGNDKNHLLHDDHSQAPDLLSGKAHQSKGATPR
jgi:hypothetical protein